MSETANTPANTTPETKPGARPKSPPAATLPEFLRATTAAPRPFLAHARKCPPPGLSDFDLHGLGVFLDTNDKAVQRLASLLAELADENSLIARQVTRVAEGYARRRIPNMEWPQLRSETSVDQIRDAVRNLLTAENDRDKRHRGRTAAFFVLWVARLRGALDGDALVALLLFAFPPKLKTSKAGKPDFGGMLAKLLHKQGYREPVLATAVHYAAKVDTANEEARALTTELDRLRLQAAQFEQTIRSLEEQVAHERRTLNDKNEVIAQLTRDLADHKAVARQAMQRLKARVNGVLQGGLMPLLRDVHDSSTMEPVRTHIILDRVETAQKTIERESQWLESSD